jgi:hypothetical protein
MKIARLRYNLGQGCKKNLVAKPGDWPGANCAAALVEGKPLAGIWFNRTAEYEARRLGKRFQPEDFSPQYQPHLAPLPCWKDLPPLTVQTYVAEIADQVAGETRQHHRHEGSRPLGLRAILRQNPHAGP